MLGLPELYGNPNKLGIGLDVYDTMAFAGGLWEKIEGTKTADAEPPPPDRYPYPRRGDGGARGDRRDRGGISLGLSIVPIITPLIIRPQRRSNPRRRLSCAGLIWEV